MTGVLRQGDNCRIKGPTNPEEAAIVERACQWRDLFLMQRELDDRLATASDSDDASDESGSTAMLLVHLFERSIPARCRLSEHEMVLRMMDHRSLTKRELLKKLYRAWREIGEPARRGMTLPPMRVARPLSTPE